MAVSVIARARHPECDTARVRRDARALLRALDEAGSELTVLLVGDEAMRDLNRRHRAKDRPTDVLAFAMREGPRTAGDEDRLGDVVISVDTAARQARRRRKSAGDEVRTLLIHGVLHLLGYDHERSPTQARRMRSKERELARLLREAGGVSL